MTDTLSREQMLSYELDGVLADLDSGCRFDNTCRHTIIRVRDELRSMALRSLDAEAVKEACPYRNDDGHVSHRCPYCSYDSSAAPDLHPYLQMALGNHTTGVFKDGKLIAADAQVYAEPFTRRELLEAYSMALRSLDAEAVREACARVCDRYGSGYFAEKIRALGQINAATQEQPVKSPVPQPQDGVGDGSTQRIVRQILDANQDSPKTLHGIGLMIETGIRQALRQRDGVVVPREPTEEMISGGANAASKCGLPWSLLGLRDIYKAMLAARPKE